ncbi:hypothetical protein Taro_018968 [Colocasia esculenta]|uniref:non-specific serine/threonine protein kinase n=1 Tax=Colocasia esculenta TaxID=4460 RepID=A0A843US53_COLES|nr:hypothetical protein [Colocasia esculenta]
MGNCASGGKSQVLPKESSSRRGSDGNRSSRKDSKAGINSKIASAIKPQRVASELRNRSAASSPEELQREESELSNHGSFRSMPKDIEDFRQNAVNDNLIVFSYNEMLVATRNFRRDKILGQGGFGVVYKGVIDENVRPGFACIQVAVKQLNPDGLQGDREWLAEVNYLGQFSHPNLVKLIGYCCEDVHRLLVYEYMGRGSLERLLFKRVCLSVSWPARVKIALAAAMGLAFLHGEERPVIYRDFKTSNILLDAHIDLALELTLRLDNQDYNAKLSDFGLAKEGPTGDQTHVSTRVMGTHGYAAPEYVMTGHLTARSDVYGYGVVLLEMLTGRRALDRSRPSREHSLVEWARPLLIHDRKLLKIIDPRIEGQYTTKTIRKVANLAYQCLSQNPRSRPTMSQVVEILESLKDLPESREDPLLLSGGNSVTLYEITKDTTDSPSEQKRCLSKAESAKVSRVHSSSRRRKLKRSRRSKSEPAMHCEQSSQPSPDSDDTLKQVN